MSCSLQTVAKKVNRTKVVFVSEDYAHLIDLLSHTLLKST